jgi:hypothetical protein
MIIINGKRYIRSLQNNLPNSVLGKSLILAVSLNDNLVKAQKIGFPESPVVGDSVLPKIIGPATRLNSYGRDLVLRNQEKETLYRTQYWEHKEWVGRGETIDVTSLVSIPYKRYPRSHTDGCEMEMVVRDGGSGDVIASASAIKYDEAHRIELVNAVNVFLEIFGYVELFDSSLEPIPTPAEVRRLNWNILPKGEKITKERLSDVLSKSKRIWPVELWRQEKISGFGPAEIAIGTAGFSGYIIYVFPVKKLAILESLRYGNASYILDDGEWETLSKMTKQQLLSNKLVKAREIHLGGWSDRITDLLK